MELTTLAALAEPNRLRIVELLDAAPRPVGEIAAVLALRQPQVTKHLQTLQAAGLVRVHPLGRRRVYALQRGPIRDLAEWAATMAEDRPSEHALIRYERAVAAETTRPAGHSGPRLIRLRRTVAARPAKVWAAWTDSAQVRQWWSPPHFHVAECVVEPVPGGTIVIVLAEGDGSRYRSRGHFTELHPYDRLIFELSPEDEQGRPMFRVVHRVRFDAADNHTTVTVSARVTDPTPDAGPALAGLRIGWEQLLDKLAAQLS